MDPFYTGTHRCQYDGTLLANQNCTPTAFANGVRATTGGRIDRSGGSMRSLVARNEETSPQTAGWSLADARLAATRLKDVTLVIGHDGWDGVMRALRAGKFVMVQGDSEEFPNGTCSGVFNGDHCIGLHPDRNGSLLLLADGICKARRWETESVLHRYATNFRPEISYAVFSTPVPTIKPPVKPPVSTIIGWVSVTGSWWPYTVRGNPTIGYKATTRAESKDTAGYKANVDKLISAHWGGRDRVWAEMVSGPAKGLWVDTLDDPQIMYYDAK